MRGSAGSATSTAANGCADSRGVAGTLTKLCGGSAGVTCRACGALPLEPLPPDAVTSFAVGISPRRPRSSSFQPGSKLDFGGMTSDFERFQSAAILWQLSSQYTPT